MSLKNKLIKLSSLSAFTLLLSPSALSAPDDTAVQSVDHVSWHKLLEIDPKTLLNQPIPENMVSLYFIRQMDQDNTQTSANIAINDHYQTSLQPGGFTQVYACMGKNKISIVTTAHKTNDLLQNAIAVNLPTNQSYFFYIDVAENSRVTLSQVNADTAKNLLKNKKYQHHQISRVVPSCTNVVRVTPPVTPPAKTPAEPAVIPVLQEKVSIEMKILFDSDKTIIKPQYFNEVAEVANFMKKYGNTVALIEGHTDSSASNSYNKKLSERRALAVKKLLITQYGIAPTRLNAIGYGEARPIATNETLIGRQQNRRVIAVVEQK